MDYKELTCSSRSHTAPRTYRIGGAVITNVESPGGPWVGFLTELFEPGDDENFPADQWKRCNIRWLDSFTSSAKEYEDVSFLRRSNVKPENGELFLSDIVDQPSNPVSVIDGPRISRNQPGRARGAPRKPARGVSRRGLDETRAILLPAGEEAYARPPATRRRAPALVGGATGRTGVGLGKRGRGMRRRQQGTVRTCGSHRAVWIGAVYVLGRGRSEHGGPMLREGTDWRHHRDIRAVRSAAGIRP